MSIIQNEIPGARVLDLFAGSGALGLEALSRGAESADFVETNSRSIAMLERNIVKLGADGSVTIHRKDAVKFASALDAGAYDIAFADPPYSGGGAGAIASIWLARHFSSILSVEHDARTALAGAADVRRYGSTSISFFRTGD